MATPGAHATGLAIALGIRAHSLGTSALRSAKPPRRG